MHIYTHFFSQILKVRHNQVGDGEVGDIAGELGWDDVCPDSHLLFRGYFLRDQRIAEKGRTEEICKIDRDSGSESTDSWQDSTRKKFIGIALGVLGFYFYLLQQPHPRYPHSFKLHSFLFLK